MSEGINVGKAYVQIVPSAKGLGGSISKMLDGEADSAGKSAGGKISGALGGALKVGLGAATAAVGAASAAVGKFASEAVSSYANYEQLVGGVDKLYGSASEKLQGFADQAYKTAGMSANAYMETATSFSASLINSLGRDVDKAADMTDVAMRAISDNVNVFGSDMGSVTNAFQGFAKQNYTMLDNLKLGYGGTKSEMERLIEDANEYAASIGEASDMSIDSFADVVNAIELIQEKQNIAGTTGKEAMNTIEGAANATKAAWSNVITAIGRGEGMQEAFDGLVSAIFGEKEGEGLLNQIIPRIQTTMEGIGDFISQAAPMLTDKLPELLDSVVPQMMESGGKLLGAIGEGILNTIPSLLSALSEVFHQIVDGLTSNISQVTEVANQIISTLASALIDAAPMMISGATQLVAGLAEGLGQMLPTLIPAAAQMVVSIAEGLIENIPMLIDGATQLIYGLTEGITQAAPILAEKIPELMTSLTQALIDNFPTIASALVQCIPLILEALVQIHLAILQGIFESAGMLLEALGEVIMEMINKIGESAGEFAGSVARTGSQVLSAFGSWLSQLPGTLAYWAGYAIGQFLKFFIDLPQNLQKIWGDIKQGVSDFATEFGRKAVDMARNFFNSLINGIRSLPSKIQDIGKELIGAVKELPEKFYNIGADIVSGLWNGIKEGWKWLTEKVSELADKLVQGVKDGLGIESPSKVFRDQVGKWIPAGIAVGIRQNLGVLDSAMKEMSDEMLGSSMMKSIQDISQTSFLSSGLEGAAGMAGYNQTINIYSPEPLSASEIARQTRNSTRNMVLALRGV